MRMELSPSLCQSESHRTLTHHSLFPSLPSPSPVTYWDPVTAPGPVRGSGDNMDRPARPSRASMLEGDSKGQIHTVIKGNVSALARPPSRMGPGGGSAQERCQWVEPGSF